MRAPAVGRGAAPVLLAVGVTLATALSPCAASTTQAWSELEREMISACTKASGLLDAKPAGKPVHFDDSVGLSALLVRGAYPQPHMNRRPTAVLCLFDRGSHRASIADAEPMLE